MTKIFKKLAVIVFTLSLLSILAPFSALTTNAQISISNDSNTYGPVALQFDAKNYNNQSAKFIICQTTSFLFEGKKQTYSFPLVTPFQDIEEEQESYSDPNQTSGFFSSYNFQIFDLSSLDDKFETITYISSGDENEISIFDVSKVKFEDEEYQKYLDALYSQIDEQNSQSTQKFKNEEEQFEKLKNFKTSFDFCQKNIDGIKYSNQAKLNSFEIKSNGSDNYTIYGFTATSNNFNLTKNENIIGKNLETGDISSGKCQSFANSWIYNEQTQKWKFDEQAPTSVAPGSFVDCTFKLKNGAYYKPINGFYDEKTFEFYSAVEIKPEVVRPTYKRNSCYIGKDYSRTNVANQFNNVFENNMLYCSFGVPFSASNGTYGVNLDFFENPGPNAVAQSFKTDATFTVDRSLIKPFDDVDIEYAFSDYIYSLKDLGVVSGSGNNQFKPEDPVTRGEMTKFVRNTFFGAFYSNTNCDDFKDVDIDNTFYYEIQTLKCEGVIGGFDDGTFRPNEPVTRGQAMKFMVAGARAASKDQSLFDTDNASKTFPDVKTGNTFYDFIVDGVANGIASGYADGTFKPDKNITRGEMTKIVVNTWEKSGLNNRGQINQTFNPQIIR